MSTIPQFPIPAYTMNQPLYNIFPAPIIAKRSPATSDKAQIGTIWINTVINGAWVLTSLVNNLANWADLSAGGGTFSSLTVNPGPTSLTGITTINGTTTINTSGNSATTIGNLTNTGGIIMRVGSGNFVLDGAPAATMTVGASLTTGTITIGGTAQTGTITLGSSSGTNIVDIGTGAGATSVNIGTGAGANVVSIGTHTANALTTIKADSTGADAAAILLDAGGFVGVTTASNSAAGTTVVLNSRVGIATYTGQTTASGSTITLTLTNSIITATSAILLTLNNVGTNDAELTVQQVMPGAGSATIIAKNNGAAALNGNINVAFWVLN